MRVLALSVVALIAAVGVYMTFFWAPGETDRSRLSLKSRQSEFLNGDDDESDDEDVPVNAMDLINLRVIDLKGKCKERGLKTTGRKAELIERLRDYVPKSDETHVGDAARVARGNIFGMSSLEMFDAFVLMKYFSAKTLIIVGALHVGGFLLLHRAYKAAHADDEL